MDERIKPGADLRGAGLHGADLHGADLRGADLRGADLCGADLRWTSLRRASLSGADLCGADLYGADLRGADLRGANLHWANLSRADLRGADLQHTLWLSNSHEAASELLRREAKTGEQERWAAWPLVRLDHCWDRWLGALSNAPSPIRDWVVSTLSADPAWGFVVQFKERLK